MEGWNNGKNQDNRKRIHPIFQYSNIPDEPDLSD
jgi:hypothetical protein